MSGRDWEGMARTRLERLVADAVSRIRDTADELEREALRNIASAAQENRVIEFQTYPRVAGQLVAKVQTMLFNLKLDNLIDAATDAEAARAEKHGPADPMTDRGSIALSAVLSAIESWEEGARENHEALDHRGENTGNECWTNWKREDIERMVDDAAREVGARMTPLRTEEKGEPVKKGRGRR